MTIYTLRRGMIVKHQGVKLDKKMNETQVEFFEAIYNDEDGIIRIRLADKDKTKLLPQIDIEVKRCRKQEQGESK
jgi:hypothetical protein